MKNKTIFAILAVIMLLASCATPKTRGEQYAQLYEEKPLTIVIMPPINQTNAVEAKDYFYTTLYTPLCEKGYYVFSPYLTMEFFQSESAYDSEMFLEQPLGTFKTALNADAAMFTIIKSWKKIGITSTITVDVEYILRSTTTGNTLYHREGIIKLDTSINAGGGLIGSIVSLAASAINTAMTDKVVAGRKCNYFVLSDMPVGKYHPEFGKDSEAAAGEKVVRATVK